MLTSTHRLLFFSGRGDAATAVQKKAKLVIAIHRDTSVVDIDNHQGHKNTFGIKVSLTDAMRSKWGLKKSKDQQATVWMYSKTHDARTPWVDKLKASIQDLMEGSKKLSPEAVEAVQQGRLREVARLLNEFEMHKDAVVHMPAKARRRLSNATGTAGSLQTALPLSNTLAVPGTIGGTSLSVSPTVSPRSPLSAASATSGSLPHSPRPNGVDESGSEDDEDEYDDDDDEYDDDDEDGDDDDDYEEKEEEVRAREAANILKMMELGVCHQDTMLIIAARHGHLDIVQKLLEKQADANKVNSDGQTALHAAMEAGQDRDAIVQALLDYDDEIMDINVQDKRHDHTPLILAAKIGEYRLVEKLLMRRANARLTAKDGMSALHYAAMNGDTKSVKLMMQRMVADPMARTLQGLSACDMAAQTLAKDPENVELNQMLSEMLKTLTNEGKFSLSEGFHDLAPVYLRRCILDNLGMHMFQEIMRADIDGHLANTEFVSHETREVLLGGLVSSKRHFRVTTTPLILAIDHTRLDMVKHLLETDTYRTDVNKCMTETDGAGEQQQQQQVVEYSAIDRALASKNEQIIDLLLQRSDIDFSKASGPDQRIPALLVIQYMASERVRNLVFDRTPLENVEDSSSITTANPNNNDADATDDGNDGQPTPPPEAAAGLARLKRTEDLVRTVVSKRMGYTMFHIAAENNDVATLRFLIEHGIEPRMTNKLNMTAVASACLTCSMDALTYLVEEIELEVCGSQREPCIEHGWPPIHAAVLSGHRTPIKYLINHGNIDVNSVPSEKHKYPIHLACMRGFLNVVQYLVHYKANLAVFVDTTDDSNLSPLHLAAAYGFHEIVEFLVDHGEIDMDLKTAAGYTALDLAMRRGNLKVVKSLCDRGAGSDELTLQLAIQTGNATILEWVERSKEIRRTRSMQFSRTDSITSV